MCGNRGTGEGVSAAGCGPQQCGPGGDAGGGCGGAGCNLGAGCAQWGPGHPGYTEAAKEGKK